MLFTREIRNFFKTGSDDMGKTGKSSIVKFGSLGVFGQPELKWFESRTGGSGDAAVAPMVPAGCAVMGSEDWMRLGGR